MALASRNICIQILLLRHQSSGSFSEISRRLCLVKKQTEGLRCVCVSRRTFSSDGRNMIEQRPWKPPTLATVNNVIRSDHSLIQTKASSFLRQNSFTSLPDAWSCKRWCSGKSGTNENDIVIGSMIDNQKVKVDQELAANVTVASAGKDNIGQIEAKMAIQYTCKVCNERNTNMFSKVAYTKGLVIVTCHHCKNRHLIADNLGWFKNVNHKNIEEMLKAHGETVRRITDSDEAMEVLTVLDSDQAKF